MSDYGNEQFAQYYDRLRDELDAVKFPIPFEHYPLDNEDRPRDPHQIKFPLSRGVRCYHNFDRETPGGSRCLYVGMGCTPKLRDRFNSFFLRKQADMEEELGFKLGHNPGKPGDSGDFWAEGVSVVGKLESFIPTSVKRLQKFEKVVFPVVRKVFPI